MPLIILVGAIVAGMLWLLAGLRHSSTGLPGRKILSADVGTEHFIAFDFDGAKGLELARQWGISAHRRSGSGGLHWDVQHPLSAIAFDHL